MFSPFFVHGKSFSCWLGSMKLVDDEGAKNAEPIDASKLDLCKIAMSDAKNKVLPSERESEQRRLS